MADWLSNLIDQITAAGETGGSASDAMPSESMAPESGAFSPSRDSAAASDYMRTFFGGERPSVAETPPAVPTGTSAPSESFYGAGTSGGMNVGGIDSGGYNPATAGSTTPPAPGFLDAVGKKIGIARNKDGSVDYSNPSTIDAIMKMVLGAGNVLGALTKSKTTPQNFQSAADMRTALLGANNNFNPTQQQWANNFFNTPMQTGINHPKLYAADMPTSLTAPHLYKYAEGGSVQPVAMTPQDAMDELRKQLAARQAYGQGRSEQVRAITPQDRQMFGAMSPSAKLNKMRQLMGGVKPVEDVKMSTLQPDDFAAGGKLGHIQADTGGQDDVVPINAAGGEYMWDADSVSALGDGNNAAGAKKLDELRERLRAHKRSAPPDKIPPKAKPIEQYMKGGK